MLSKLPHLALSTCLICLSANAATLPPELLPNDPPEAEDLEDSGDPEDDERRTQSGFEDIEQFGGPGSVGRGLEEDDRITESPFRFDGLQRGLSPYFDWKARLNAEHGLALGLDYTGNFYSASEDLGGEDSAGSGNLRLFGSWTVLESDAGSTGSLVFKVEDRHAYSKVPASGLGLETGYVGLLAPPFNDNGSMLTNLYWLQKFNDNRTTLAAGIVDATDYVDVYGLVNPWTHFGNLVFSTGSGTMPAPNQGIGAVVGSFFGDGLYASAGAADANGDPTDLGDSLDSAFGDAEYFTHVELGATSSFEARYLNNMHVTLWHAAERTDAGVPDGWGVNVSFTRFFDEQWLPFLRAGYSDDGGALLEKSVSAGLGYYMPGTSDLLALGLNWGLPAEDFGPDPDEQFTTEAFYRLQLSQNFAVTPSLQYVTDPALNPTEDSMWFLGLRVRLSL